MIYLLALDVMEYVGEETEMAQRHATKDEDDGFVVTGERRDN